MALLISRISKARSYAHRSAKRAAGGVAAESRRSRVEAGWIGAVIEPESLSEALHRLSSRGREQAVQRQKAELERFRTEQLQKVASAEAGRLAAEEEAKRIRIQADARAYEIAQINKAIARSPP